MWTTPTHSFQACSTKECGHERTQKGLDLTVVRVNDTASRSNDGCEDNPFLDTLYAIPNIREPIPKEYGVVKSYEHSPIL